MAKPDIGFRVVSGFWTNILTGILNLIGFWILDIFDRLD
jgi:hypothetical protein